jgi:hypothetical protein
MNTVWNLTEFSELEDRVLTEATGRPRRRRRGQSAFRAVVTVAAAATALAVVPIKAHATTTHFSVPCLEAAACGLELEPPLEDLFVGRFSPAWSESDENALLARIHERTELAKEDLEDQAVHSIFFNQQDEPSQAASSLSVEEIRRIVKRRKLI